MIVAEEDYIGEEEEKGEGDGEGDEEGLRVEGGHGERGYG